MSPLRFVVGSLGNCERAVSAVEDLRARNLPCDSIGIVARRRVLDNAARLAALAGDASAVLDPSGAPAERIVCFGRRLDDMLGAHTGQDCRTLKEALERWLLPRHAEALSAIVERDGILVWAEVRTAEEERAASLSLLRNSSGTVAVHDLAPEPALAGWA
jgi:hypothetical protein